MKLSAHLTLIALVGMAAIPAASAQDARPGARFNFAPNVWKSESSRIPKGYGDFAEPAHKVQPGAVCKSPLDGVDAIMLSKPAPQPVVTTAVTPQVMVPKANANFNPAFGHPTLAQLPVVPQHAIAQPMAPMARPVMTAPVAQAARPMVRTAVAARLKAPAYHSVRPTNATPAIASYAPNMGYVPGSMLTRPSSNGGGSATATVSGKILMQKPHR